MPCHFGYSCSSPDPPAAMNRTIMLHYFTLASRLPLSRWTRTLVLLAFLFIPGLTVPADDASGRRPNVLLILVDDLKPALGCYGDPVARSPHIDRLAARGMRFDLAYCNQAVCAPSRYNLMLGARSTSTGLYHLGQTLRDEFPDAVTMPQYFSQHGYRSQSLGKVFHIGHGNLGDDVSWDVPHFGDKVVEYVLPESTGGQVTREEAYFNNIRTGVPNKDLPRGAAWEAADVPDEAYADGRVAAETLRPLPLPFLVEPRPP